MTTPPSQTQGEMLPCPFCGGEPMMGFSSGVVDHVYCLRCKAKTNHYQNYSELGSGSVAAWQKRADLAESRGSSPEWLQAIGKMLLEDLLTINVTDNARPIHFLILKELYDEIRLAKKALPLPPSERNGE